MHRLHPQLPGCAEQASVASSREGVTHIVYRHSDRVRARRRRLSSAPAGMYLALAAGMPPSTPTGARARRAVSMLHHS